jgi:hypothetical protein
VIAAGIRDRDVCGGIGRIPHGKKIRVWRRCEVLSPDGQNQINRHRQPPWCRDLFNQNSGVAMSELTVIEIKPEQAPALYVPNGLDVYLEKSENWQMKFLTCPRKRPRSHRFFGTQLARSKKHRRAGARLSETPQRASKEVEAELRRFVTECDTIRDAISKPRVEWEQAEESRKNALQQRLNDLVRWAM